MHQVLVRVEGWDQVAPVSVDKVGVYFRLAKPQTNQVSAIVSSHLGFVNIFCIEVQMRLLNWDALGVAKNVPIN